MNYDRRKWVRTEDGGHPIYSNGTYEIRRVDSTARSRYSWVLFDPKGEPVTKPGRFGPTIVAGDTLAEAKALAAKYAR
jgi:hypothetical protein